jgi:hypothetical protein
LPGVTESSVETLDVRQGPVLEARPAVSLDDLPRTVAMEMDVEGVVPGAGDAGSRAEGREGGPLSGESPAGPLWSAPPEDLQPTVAIELPPGEPAPVDAADALPTPTLAELYVEQGMTAEAVRVYERLLMGDPENDELRERLSALRGEVPAEPVAARRKIEALQGWLERIRRSRDAQSRP